jgi:hypothetical protein
VRDSNTNISVGVSVGNAYGVEHFLYIDKALFHAVILVGLALWCVESNQTLSFSIHEYTSSDFNIKSSVWNYIS